MNQIARQTRPAMTAEEFLIWPGDGSGQKFELVDGALRPMSPASYVHGAIQMRLGHLLWTAIEASGAGLEVASEGAIIPGIRPSMNVRIPDVVVTAAPVALDQIAVPEPILLIEILSPGNQKHTQAAIESYKAIGSVIEIVVLHSRRPRAEIHRRENGGAWPALPEVVGPGGRLRLASAGLDVAIERAYPASAFKAESSKA